MGAPASGGAPFSDSGREVGRASEQTYVLGLDTGGTKTRALLVDARGQVIGVGRAGPANRFFVEPQALVATLQEAALTAMRSLLPGPVPLAVVCVVGPSGKEPAEAMVANLAAQGVLAAGAVVIRPLEPEPGLVTVTAERLGVAVVAGTGSSAWGVGPDGQEHFTGGWGAAIGDEGSAYWIVREAIRRAARAEDGRGPRTELAERFCRALGLARLRDVVPEVYGGRLQQRHQIAAWCPLVAEVARGGDPVANAVWVDAAEELAAHAAACARALAFERTVPCACLGGVFKAGELVLRPLAAAIARTGEPLAPMPAPYEPVVGTAAIALRHLHGAVTRDLIDRVGRGATSL